MQFVKIQEENKGGLLMANTISNASPSNKRLPQPEKATKRTTSRAAEASPSVEKSFLVAAATMFPLSLLITTAATA